MRATVNGSPDRSRSRRSAAERSATAIRLPAALVFATFGAGKFFNHASELASFRQYGLPLTDLFVYAIGVIELVGGLMLLSGRLVRLAALALAADMVGAIVVSGIGQGEGVSLTLAPALLAAMLYLIGLRDRRLISWRSRALERLLGGRRALGRRLPSPASRLLGGQLEGPH